MRDLTDRELAQYNLLLRDAIDAAERLERSAFHIRRKVWEHGQRFPHDIDIVPHQFLRSLTGEIIHEVTWLLANLGLGELAASEQALIANVSNPDKED
jgi:hypothetical protein